MRVSAYLLWISLLIGIFVVGGIACGGGGEETTPLSTPTLVTEEIPLDHIILTPITAEFDIGQAGTFTAMAIDASGSPAAEALISWKIADDLGSITDEGQLSVGTKAGTFDNGITVVATLNGVSVETLASVTVNPGSPESFTVSEIEIAAGETQQLEIAATDAFGNTVSDLETDWTISHENAGTLTKSGLLTASEVAGTFLDTVQVEVTHDGEIHSAIASVTIVPGPLEQVVIAPNSAEIGIKMSQQFVAVGADQYGNRIPDLMVEWSIENSPGTIDDTGLFITGISAQKYENNVKATVVQDSITRFSTASVSVAPDRIAFSSDRNGGQFDIYMMNKNGDDIEQMTNSPDTELFVSWSPDGRRIAYDTLNLQYGMSMFVMNDNGSWQVPLGSLGTTWQPSWSPDGSKVAYISLDEDTQSYELCVMDVDGGNSTTLTSTTNTWENSPTWSPDGTKLAYYSFPMPSFDSLFTDDYDNLVRAGDIYVIDVDGSNEKCLLCSKGDDCFPAWSPDGSKIAFTSDKDGNYRIYVMNADGTNVKQFTKYSWNPGLYMDEQPAWSHDGDQIIYIHGSLRANEESYEIYVKNSDGTGGSTQLTRDSAFITSPRWSPRKQGISVDEASIVIPNMSTHTKSLTVQQVTAQA
ncbi:MAG: hypothetical protein GY845_02445, partial [Planctomycetes bacterium]|nr:hypothetical protein [Planctomycetota bacterium]